jgi:hypothetical protein
MEILKLVIVFAVMLILVARKVPLLYSASAAALVCWVLYQVPVGTGFAAIGSTFSNWNTIQLIILMYVITFMQSMLKQKHGIDRSQKALTRLFHNNWVTCTVAPFIIGLVPAAPAVYLSGDIINSAAGDRLDNETKATAASFFRHVSESFMPTYPDILTALTLTGLAAGKFVLGMLPLVLILILLGCFFLYRGRLPIKADDEKTDNKLEDLKQLILGLWPMLLAIVLIVNFGMNVLVAVLAVTIAYYFLGGFTFNEIRPYFKSSFDWKTTSDILGVFFFQAILGCTDVIGSLPSFFGQLPIPTYMVFVLIIFFGSIVAGSLTITTTMIPVAFAAIPDAGYPLLCLLMCTVYAAMQVSPTHVCLSLSCENFHVPLSSLIRKTLPIIVSFLVIACIYYQVWTAVI